MSGTLDIRYRNAHFSWPSDLLSIIRESSFKDKFAKVLRKCNFPFEGIHENNILSWKDNQDIINDDDSETYTFPISTFHLTNTDTYHLSIEASTSQNSNRWFAKIMLTLSAKNNSRYSGRMYFNTVDFLAIRDFFIEYLRDESKFFTILPSKKSIQITKEDSGNLNFEIDGQKMIFYPEYIKYLAQGVYMQKMSQTMTCLNYEMTPTPITRWWFKEGSLIMDVGVDRFNDRVNTM